MKPTQQTAPVSACLAALPIDVYKRQVMLLLKLIFHRQDTQELLKKLLEREKPVSYTHLDVYKRQQHDYPLKGLVRCGNCKRAMTRRKNKAGIRYFQCIHSRKLEFNVHQRSGNSCRPLCVAKINRTLLSCNLKGA